MDTLGYYNIIHIFLYSSKDFSQGINSKYLHYKQNTIDTSPLPIPPNQSKQEENLTDKI